MRLFEDDARLLLCRAAMHEDYAGARIQRAIWRRTGAPSVRVAPGDRHRLEVRVKGRRVTANARPGYQD